MPRNYSSVAPEKILSTDVSNTSPTITLNNLTGLPAFPYALVINPDTVIEEIVVATSILSGTTLNVTRAAEASTTAPGSTAKFHSQGNKVRHMITASDLQDSADHIAAIKNIHGISDVADNGVVGKKDAQTLENKTLSTPTINTPIINTPTINAGVAGSVPISSTELGYLDGLTGKLTDLLLLKANAASPTFTGTVSLPAATSIGTVTNVEIGYLDNVTSSIQTQLNNNTPVGAITMWAHQTQATLPTGWIECNGQSTSTYAALALVVGPNVPDLRGRFPVGFSGSDPFNTWKGTGGNSATQAHTHTTVNAGGHAHGGTPIGGNVYRFYGNTYNGAGSHTHDVNGSTTAGNDHDHAAGGARTETAAEGIGASNASVGLSTLSGAANTTGSGHEHPTYLDFVLDGDHGHTINAFGTGALSTSIHGNLPPYFALKFIIKT